MSIFVDSADVGEVRRWLNYGVVDGVTTNPSIMLKCGQYDQEACARELAEIWGDRPLSVEVTTDDQTEMLEQARLFASWAPNIVVKITIVTTAGEPNLGVVKTLTGEGIKVNCTACMSVGQVILAAKAGATYASLFVGRINDEGNDGPTVIRNARHWLDMWGYPTKIIVGSVRSVMDIQQAALAGAHVITIPPEFLPKLVDHRYSRATVAQFLADGEKALAELAARRSGAFPR